MRAEGCDEAYIKNQIEKYGYDPANLHGVRFLRTESGRLVKLDTAEDHESRMPTDSLMAIAGSTESAEDNIRGLRGTGLIVARYSIFYGGPSGYTGRTPEQGGYALDIPKKVETAKALITDDAVIDALVAREADKIREAIGELNKRLNVPVLVTPYLEEALAGKVPHEDEEPAEPKVGGKYDPVRCAGCPIEAMCRDDGGDAK
jgi:hypothetical protein